MPRERLIYRYTLHIENITKPLPYEKVIQEYGVKKKKKMKNYTRLSDSQVTKIL